jgi:L-lactate dehydrogenase (cytochrome)
MIIANIDDYRRQCEARLPRFLYDYISGGSYQENTLRANIAELQDTLLRQRVMVDESHLNFSIHLWDQALSLPVVLGPVGMAGMYSSRGEVKAANAAKAVGFRLRYPPWGCATCTRSRKRPAFPLGSNSICSKTAVSSRA